MRIANIKSGSLIGPTIHLQSPLLEGDHSPCYYANIEKGEKRKEWSWSVGCKHQGKKEEYSFKLPKLGDVNDDELWNRITSFEFAKELIDLFRDGGELGVKNWIKDGCP
jgi:hypothetical protein